jgi:hypothetical protein
LRIAHSPATALGIAGALALAVSCAPPPKAVRAEALPFIEDDYGRALAQAKAKKLPIFADAWAPW